MSDVLRHVHNFRVARHSGGISLTAMGGGSASRIAIHASKNAARNAFLQTALRGPLSKLMTRTLKLTVEAQRRRRQRVCLQRCL